MPAVVGGEERGRQRGGVQGGHNIKFKIIIFLDDEDKVEFLFNYSGLLAVHLASYNCKYKKVKLC